MLRKIFLPFIFLILGYGFWISPNFKEIAAGVSIFLFGMIALEEGFRTFSGGYLEKILKASTDKLWKSIGFGFVSTALMQSSSLVSVLTISFIGAGLIGLAQGIGIIFGANIGTTTGAWLMAGFGLKVKISAYAMPMLVFGVIMIFQRSKSIKGVGYVLTGLGFLFLGIHYMKEGFEAFKHGVDLSTFAVGGFRGLLIYILVGILATVVMQSSHATIILVLAALASGEITYENAIALTIGANIGTTVTAIIGSLGSNIDGKRLAGAHFIFNITTAAVTLLIMHPFIDAVNYISNHLGIAADNHTLRLAVFDSMFKIMGVVIFIPFVNPLVQLLHRLFKAEKEEKAYIEKARYLNESALEFPETSFKAILDESRSLMDRALSIISKGLSIPREQEISWSRLTGPFPNIDEDYQRQLKGVYAEIVEFSISAQTTAGEEYINRFYNIKLANRNIIEAVKMTQQLQINLRHYLNSDNEHIKEQYTKMIKRISKLIKRINEIRNTNNKETALYSLQRAKKILAKNDIVANGKLDKLIRSHLITNEMAASLMNDSAYTNNIIKSLIVAAGVLWIDPAEDIEVYREEIGR